MQTKKPKATAIYMRLASIIGIILLLVLQFIWFKNAYKMVDQEIMEKCKVCLRDAVDAEMFERYDILSIKTYVNKDQNFDYQDYDAITSVHAERSEDLNIGLQEVLYTIGSKISLKRVDTLFINKIKSQLGYIPKYKLAIINDTISIENLYQEGDVDMKDFIRSKAVDSIEKQHKTYGDSILYYVIKNHEISLRINSKQIVKMEVTYSSNIFLNKAKFLITTSILIVLLIGFIMISQLRTVLKEHRFVQFIKEYTSAITHDLQTPLNNIFLASELLSLGKFENDISTRNNYYKICKDQSERQIRNVRKILLLAKDEHSHITVEKQYVMLKEFLEGIAEYFRKGVLYSKEQIKINIQCEPENLMVNIDTDKMENVMNNLIDNAIKYSYESVHIDINCSIDGENVFIKVKDNGMGIDAQDLDKIFKNFGRGSQMERKRIFGYGIGLTFVEKVVQAHGGEITVNSKENEGSEFILSFPK